MVEEVDGELSDRIIKLEAGESEAYDYSGKVLADPQDSRGVCMIHITRRAGPRFYIKVANGDIYSAAHHLSFQLGKVKAGLPVWEYKRVNRKCIDYYLHFLQHTDARSFNQAVREFKNG